jgi:hypothetical protein
LQKYLSFPRGGKTVVRVKLQLFVIAWWLTTEDLFSNSRVFLESITIMVILKSAGEKKRGRVGIE